MDSVVSLIRQIRDRKQRVIVFGAGKTGLALVRFFLGLGISVELWDQLERDSFLKSKTNQDSLRQLEDRGVIFKFEGEKQAILDDIALLVPSPGIPPSSPLFAISKFAELPQIPELELGMQLFAEAYKTPQIVVTGSNGKSTTTALIHFILKKLNFNSVLCGNIGEPIIEKLPSDFLESNSKLDCILSIEASSYQLENSTRCQPNVAVVLNLTENHLDRHGSMANYLEAKKNLVRRLRQEASLVINDDDTFLPAIRDGVAGIHKTFGVSRNCNACIDLNAKQIIFRANAGSEVFNQNHSCLIGAHNLYNVAAAILACESMGCNLKSAIEAAYEFKGLEHRLEMIRLPGDRLAINDSKATTVSASLAAVKAVVASNLNRKINLLLGGEEKKGSDWRPLFDFISENKKSFEQLWLFGACKDKLSREFSNLPIEIKIYSSLASTKVEMLQLLSDRNLFLLSPGCASFDEFSDFEDRGRFYKSMLG